MDQQCLAAAALADNLFMKAVLFVKVAVCLMGMYLTFWNFKNNGVDWLGHANAKLIYICHLASTFLVSVFFFAIHSLDFLRLSQSHSDPCDYRVPVTLSLGIRVPCQIFIYCQVLTILTLALERLLASWQPREYEKITDANFGRVTVSLAFIFSVAFCSSMIVSGVPFSKASVGFNTKTTENAERFSVVIWSLLPIQVSAILLFHVVHCCSRRQFEEDLGSRYQKSENRRICHHLLPVFYSFFGISFCSTLGISLFPYVYPQGTEATFAVFIECIGWVPLYACVMPIIVHLRAICRRRRQQRLAQLGSKSSFQPIPGMSHDQTESPWKHPMDFRFMHREVRVNKI